MPIFYSALLLTGVNLLLRFVATSFQVYISGTIGAEGIGLLQLVMSVGALAMTAGMAGVRTATMYLTAEELGHGRTDKVTWVLSGCFLYSILCSGGISLCLYSLAPFLANNWIGNPATADAIRLYACFLPVNCLCGVMTGYFMAANRIGTLSAVEVADQIVYMVTTMIFLVQWAGNEPVRACQSMIIGSGVSCCVTLAMLVSLRLMEKPSTGSRIPVGSRLLNIAVPLGLADDLKIGINTTENLMVPKRLARYPKADNPLAAFGAVCGMVFPVLMFPAAILYSLAELLIPELARCAAAGSTRRIHYLVRRSLRFAAVYGCLFCGLEFIFAKDLCIQLYSNTDAGNYLKLYAILIPMLYCDTITDAMTKGLGQQKACVRYNILTSTLDVVFLFVLLPRYGMMGYFVSFFITHLLNFILSLRRLCIISGIRIRVLAVLLLIAGTGGAVAISSCAPSMWCRGIVFPVALGCIFFLLGIVGSEDLQWLRGLIKKR